MNIDQVLQPMNRVYNSIQGVDDKYLVNNKLIVNHKQKNFLDELKKGLSECEQFYMSVAFINFSGLQLLLDTFKELEEKGVQGKILTSTYLNFTEPKALERIGEFTNLDLKIFVATKELGFHTKAYIFENKEEYKIIIGSSNITQRALKSNIEWNVRIISKKDDVFAKEVLEEYLGLWNRTQYVDKEFIEAYEKVLKELKKMDKNNQVILEGYEIIRPNEMQQKAVESIERLRKSGENKALVIAATGTGKTYMSAFDVMQYNPQKMLFLVHREEILKEAQKTFKKLVKNKYVTTGILTGSQKELEADYLFATIQSMKNRLEEFEPEEFEYIVLDEAHHVASESYKQVLNYFKPKFLLGMTATPERCDGADIFEVFDYNVALEVRLHEALSSELVIPFHYFGITDIEGIDLSEVKLENTAELSRKLKVNERVDFIIEKMNFYGYDGEKRKAIGFCASRDHAEYMAMAFNRRGIPSICLTGDQSPLARQKGIEQLQSDEDELEVIFTVDIFNEGVDIPSINLVLMLRPTASPVVFIQQLGRGLRKHEDKTFLTVLDFIGNHQKTFLIALALNGSRYYDKDSLKVAVATQFGDIPGCTHIQMDRIAQKTILDQLSTENFNTMKYLKEEYAAFKEMNSGRIPYLMMDYIRYEGAPDPLRFVNKEKSYLGFVGKIEKDEEILNLLNEEDFLKVLKELSNKLPLKRPHEFALMKYMLNHEVMNIKQASHEVNKYINHIGDTSIEHALSCVSQAYYDSQETRSYMKCFEYTGSELIKTQAFIHLIEQPVYRVYMEDILNYGLIRYEKEFGDAHYGLPFFKRYEQYKMIDAAILSNYTKIHSSFRGQGLLSNENEYFLFADIHKEEDIKESINYKDRLLDCKRFQYQTPNSTSQTSKVGLNIIKHQERGINLHIFIRKYKEIDGAVQPFIYLGKGDVIAYEGEKPITIILALEHEVPISLYTEITEQV